jgi:hypothetical protein
VVVVVSAGLAVAAAVVAVLGDPGSWWFVVVGCWFVVGDWWFGLVVNGLQG